jgi:TPP-dependent 2-oxoacid decarboxylase
MSDQIEFMQYVVERLKQCGVKYVFGVPGDYSLTMWVVGFLESAVAVSLQDRQKR